MQPKPAAPQPDLSLNIDLAATLAESLAMSKKVTPASGPWDVIVVGSGAAGGMAAFQLATAGIKVLVLEAGRMLDWQKEYRTMEWPYQSLRRHRLPPEMRGLNVATTRSSRSSARSPITRATRSRATGW
jgi:choline dehydrogenase-like flavoprotein